VRQIESKTTRTVHFLFDTKQKVKITPFARKYLRLIDGDLKKFEEEETEKFAQYIQAIENETLEGGNEEWNILKYNPVKYDNSPFLTFEMTGLNRIAFSVADDPFYKPIRAKYYPEVVVMNLKGEIKATVNSVNRKYSRKG